MQQNKPTLEGRAGFLAAPKSRLSSLVGRSENYQKEFEFVFVVGTSPLMGQSHPKVIPDCDTIGYIPPMGQSPIVIPHRVDVEHMADDRARKAYETATTEHRKRIAHKLTASAWERWQCTSEDVKDLSHQHRERLEHDVRAKGWYCVLGSDMLHICKHANAARNYVPASTR
ncbi:MAG: hypothetical protein KGL39_09425 [Patescibacteria group bacterium]|nr:hypothetical protein [Patescibacteria group bacterium]